MNWKSIIAIIEIIGTMQCANLSSGDDFAGGGVIGNPSGFTLTFSDTIKCKPKTSISFLGVDLTTPAGSSNAQTGQKQQYSSSGDTIAKRFRFAGINSSSITEWSKDSLVDWTWTSAGVCTVQVQIETDTAKWSEPLIVTIQK